ncbi:MAG: YajQ family cyclic di-GMP-binding protein [Verrucomicrobiae bacterium]|nr:YajQ family cyclic di-GMP-binding protein [Verrucomicrobiae bacterium]
MPSFDILSEANLMEVDNAVNQTRKELTNRFDFKDAKWELGWDRVKLSLSAESEYRLGALREVLLDKLAKRGVSLKSLDQKSVEIAPMGGARQEIGLVMGIETEKAKPIVQAIRETKLKVQAQIMDKKVRVTGKSRDDLQAAIAAVRAKDFGLALSFGNYRD